MGQYQQSQLNLKGCKLELAQRNSQTTVPFLISNYGYGLLWNNPGIGKLHLQITLQSGKISTLIVLIIGFVQRIRQKK